jgi:hypothetical protein
VVERHQNANSKGHQEIVPKDGRTLKSAIRYSTLRILRIAQWGSDLFGVCGSKPICWPLSILPIAHKFLLKKLGDFVQISPESESRAMSNCSSNGRGVEHVISTAVPVLPTTSPNWHHPSQPPFPPSIYLLCCTFYVTQWLLSRNSSPNACIRFCCSSSTFLPRNHGGRRIVAAMHSTC